MTRFQLVFRQDGELDKLEFRFNVLAGSRISTASWSPMATHTSSAASNGSSYARTPTPPCHGSGARSWSSQPTSNQASPHRAPAMPKPTSS
jgi:hypothetical protein